MSVPVPTAQPDIRLGPPTPRVALLGATVVAVAVVLYLGREVLQPFVVGLLVVWLLSPLVDRISRRGVPRWVSILLVYALVVVVIVLGMNLMISAIVAEIRNFIEDLPSLADRLQEQLERISRIYEALDIPPEFRELINTELARLAAEGIAIDIAAIVRPVFTSVGSLVGAIFGYLIIPVWAFYLLKDRLRLQAAFERSLPPAWREDTLACLAIAGTVFGRWLRGQLILGVTVGIATFIGLTLLSFIDPIFGRYAVLLSVIAGVLELLPIVGPIIAAIPAVLIAATAGVVPALSALGLYFVIQQVENTILVPRVQGDATEMHPAAVIFVIILGASVAGLLGAILALPLTATARDVYRYLFRRLSPNPPPSARALAEAMGTAPDASSIAKGQTEAASVTGAEIPALPDSASGHRSDATP
jgi:predicted PurR-regulated permease PerM